MAASLKISELNAMTAVADDDLFLITDTSATTSKKLAFSTLKSSIGAAAHTVMGVAFGTAHLGTFSGTTIADSQTVKQALQALETAAELRATSASPTLTGTISLAGEGTFKGLDDNLELDPSGTTGILKIGTKLLSSHQMEIGTVGFQTMLKGVVAINHANSELKIQNSNRIYVENTPVILDGGGVVTIADNNAAALDIKEGSNSLLKIITTNGSELTELGTALTISGLTTLDGGGTLGVDGSDAANFELNKTGTSGLIKLGTRMVSSQKQVIGTPSFDTTLKGTIAMMGTTSEYKIQNANRVYIENTPIVLDNGGVVTISDNNAAALDIKEGSNSLLKIVTTNGSESVAVGTNLSVAGALVLDSAIIANVQTSGESFADNDTSVMTSKAIDDRIAVTAATAVTQAGLHIDDIHTALGIASEAVNFGTFTGSTIGDNLTLKAVAQALETATELRAPLAAPTFTGTATFAGGGELEASGSDFAINKSGSSGLIKIGTGMTGSQKQEIGTVNIDTTLKGVIAMSGATSEYKIQSANRVYLEATPIVFDNGGTVTVSDNQAAALDIKEGSNSLLKIVTTNGSEAVAVGTNLTVAGNLSVTGTTTTVDTVTMTATNALVFEGATADDHESTLTIVDPTADRTIKLPDQSGCLPVLAADSTTAITSTPEELNLLDGITAGTVSASLAVIADSNKDVTGFRNVTLTGELDAATGDFSGDVDIDGTTNLDAVDIDGAVQLDGTFTVGVDDTGFDVKFFGDAASAYMLWDASSDDLILGGAAGLIVPDGQLTLGSTAVTSTAAELNVTDGVTAGTVIASKALVADANIDITGGRNITITGELDAATLDISGNADIDGTTNLDVVDIDGATQIDATVTVGVDDTGYDVKFFGATSGASLLWDESADDLILAGAAGLVVPDGKLTLGSTAVTSTAAELNLVDGITAGTVAASKAVIVDSNKDALGFRNVTATGEVDCATLDVSSTSAFADNVVIENGKEIRLSEASGNGTNYTGFKAPAALTANVSFTLPDGDGTDGQVITTNGSAVLAWSDAPSPSEFTGVTAGTVSASKGVEVDSNKDITGFRNVTLTGELDAATGDFSGDVDIDGTANLDAVDIDGVVQIDGATTFGVDDTGVDVKFFGATSGAYMLWDESEDDLVLAGAAGLDIAGNIDVDGTSNLDAVDIDGDVDLAGDLTFSAAKDIHFPDNEAAALEFAQAGNAYLTFVSTNSSEAVKISKNLDIDADDIDVSTQVTDIKIIDNQALALRIMEGSTEYLRVTTTNSGEKIDVSTSLQLDGAVDINGAVDCSGDVTFSDAQSISMADNLGFALRVMEGSNEYVRFVTTDGSEEVDFSKSVKLDGGLTLGSGINIPASQDVTLVASNSNALDFVIASGNRMMRFNTSTETVLMEQNIDVGGTANLDAVDIDGDVDMAGDLTFSAAKDIQIVDNSGVALEIAEAGNNYMTFVTTNDSEAIKIEKTLDLDANLNVATQATDILMKDNQAAALDIMEGSNSYLKFDTTNSSELITATKALNVAGGLQIGGTAVTATAAELNLLDDSAQTTWTAQLEGSTGNPGSKITATGEYVRMGKIIIASVHFNSVDTSSYSGDISISGLPVGSKNTSTAMFMGNVYNSGMISGATDSIQALVADNGTTISFLENANASALAWGTVGAGKSMRVQVVYISA
jgi:hypothetical protein